MEVEEKEHTLWEEERGKEPPRERMVNHLARCMPVEVEPEDTIISRTDPCLGRPAALASGKNGAANTGGGGGGSGYNYTNGSAKPVGGDGGSGIVLVKLY